MYVLAYNVIPNVYVHIIYITYIAMHWYIVLP